MVPILERFQILMGNPSVCNSVDIIILTYEIHAIKVNAVWKIAEKSKFIVESCNWVILNNNMHFIRKWFAVVCHLFSWCQQSNENGKFPKNYANSWQKYFWTCVVTYLGFYQIQFQHLFTLVCYAQLITLTCAFMWIYVNEHIRERCAIQS